MSWLVLFTFWYVKATYVKHYYGSRSLNFTKRYTQRRVISSSSQHPQFPIPPFFLPLSHPLPVSDQFLVYQAYFFWIPFAVMGRYTCVFLHFLFYMEGPLLQMLFGTWLFFFPLTVMSCRSPHIISAYLVLLDIVRFPSGRTVSVCTTTCHVCVFPHRFTNRICCRISKFLLVWEVKIGVSRYQ